MAGNRRNATPLGLICFLLFLSVWSSAGAADHFDGLPTQGQVTMIDLGAKKCIPCKMMAPILEKLSSAYKDRADIVFIDVWQHREQAARFGIRAIPTQIFYDKHGAEVYRHIGFMGEADIIKQLERMGVKR